MKAPPITPGDWHVTLDELKFPQVTAPSGIIVLMPTFVGEGPNNVRKNAPEIAANARAAAAIPKLLAALEKIHEAFDAESRSQLADCDQLVTDALLAAGYTED